jgi:hypothetical protein
MHFACRSNGDMTDITPPYRRCAKSPSSTITSTQFSWYADVRGGVGGPCCACIIVEKAALFSRLARNKQMRVSPTPKYNNIYFSPRIVQHAMSLRTEPWILVQE